MWTIFKVFIGFITYCFHFMFWCFDHKARGILASWPGIEPTPPALAVKVLTTGPPGKSWDDGIWLGRYCHYWRCSYIEAVWLKLEEILPSPWQIMENHSTLTDRIFKVSDLLGTKVWINQTSKERWLAKGWLSLRQTKARIVHEKPSMYISGKAPAPCSRAGKGDLSQRHTCIAHDMLSDIQQFYICWYRTGDIKAASLSSDMAGSSPTFNA